MQSTNPKSPRAFRPTKSIASARSIFTSNTSMRPSRHSAWNNTRSCSASLARVAGRLLVTQGFDRIEVGGAIRGVKTEGDANSRADKKSSNCPAEREDDVHLQPCSEQIACDDSKNDSENSTGFRDEHCLGEELAQNIATACADRFPHTDFFCPLGNAHQHDVHDPDPGSQKRDEADDERTDSH